MTSPSFEAAHDALTLAYVLHVGGGTIGLFSGVIAAFAKKGETLHRVAGNVFFVSMLVMAAFAALLATIIPGQFQNFTGALLTFYLVTTAWLTVRRAPRTSGVAEKFALVAILCLALPLAGLAIAGLTGTMPQIRGPFLIAAVSIALIAMIAAIGDATVVFAGGIAGAARVARHLWRMLTALTFAFGSAFTNGLPRLLPGPFHVPPAFFAPMLLPLGLLVFWMIRVRLTGWIKRSRFV